MIEWGAGEIIDTGIAPRPCKAGWEGKASTLFNRHRILWKASIG